jgi:hypothetical protein
LIGNLRSGLAGGGEKEQHQVEARRRWCVAIGARVRPVERMLQGGKREEEWVLRDFSFPRWPALFFSFSLLFSNTEVQLISFGGVWSVVRGRGIGAGKRFLQFTHLPLT